MTNLVQTFNKFSKDLIDKVNTFTFGYSIYLKINEQIQT